MKLKLNSEEQKMFENFAQSHEGTVLIGFVQRLISSVESVRTNLEIPIEARIATADILEANFVDRLRVLRGEVEAPDSDEFE